MLPANLNELLHRRALGRRVTHLVQIQRHLILGLIANQHIAVPVGDDAPGRGDTLHRGERVQRLGRGLVDLLNNLIVIEQNEEAQERGRGQRGNDPLCEYETFCLP